MTPVFIFERLCSIIFPEEADTGEFYLSLEKDPQQEEFLQVGWGFDAVTVAVVVVVLMIGGHVVMAVGFFVLFVLLLSRSCVDAEFFLCFLLFPVAKLFLFYCFVHIVDFNADILSLL